MDKEDSNKLFRPFHVATTEGAFVDGFGSKDEAANYSTNANVKADALGIKARYVVVEGPRRER